MKNIDKLLKPGNTQEQTDKIMHDMLSSKFDQELRARLQSKLETDYKVHRTKIEPQLATENSATFNLKKVFSIAATFAILITAGYFINQSFLANDGISSAQKYLAEANLKYHDITRASDSKAEFSKKEAYALFNKGDFQATEALLGGMDHLSTEDKYYRAYCLMRSNKMAAAIPLLKELNTTLDIDAKYARESKLYLAICFKETNAKSELDELLKTFTEGTWEYNEFNKI